MAPRYSQEDTQLVADLHKLSMAAPKLVKSSIYAAPADLAIAVRSWKMNEYKYYDIPSPFPTLARGLFTTRSPDEDKATAAQEIQHRIVARGYDKFFNIGEVPWTTWASLEAQTGAPYILSLKSNGCIIFIAALTPSKLLITSKHSIGPITNSVLSHAQVGETWIRKYLAEKGKTEEQLAATLWKKNWTAIAELCDDSFEEHVLGYPPEKTGLHLHGINESTKQFKTLPHTEVDAFAEEWGFIKTPSTVLQTIPEVKSFTDEVARTGKWQGEAVEGFVVRTHVTGPPTGRDTLKGSPYPPGSSFFFKVKFDEPYMMYRDWREITKSLLSTKGLFGDVKLPKSKMKRPETRLYVKWVTEQIKEDRKPFAEYTKGKGIISTREKFLAWLETDVGKRALGNAKANEDAEDRKPDGAQNFGKTVILPVAIPGVGKTAVAVALVHIFGFGHTQSDDVRAKKPAPAFIKNVVALLKDHDVVIADKNNHLRQHRQSLREVTCKMTPPVRLLCLNWSLDMAPSTIHRICGDRVMSRGDNHQSLRADVAAKMHEEVIWQFITGTEELSDNEVDAVVDMEIEDTLEQSINKAVDGCVRILGIARPSPEKITEALEMAKAYAVKVKRPDEKKKKFSPRYFGLLAEVDLQDVIGKRMESGADLSQKSKDFWTSLKANRRVTKRPHVTIVHQHELRGNTELWERCMGLHHMAIPPLFKFKLTDVVWNDRIMAATVSDLQLDTDVGENADSGLEGHDFVSKLADDVRGRLHVTVGTRDANVPPVEAKALVEAWRRGDHVLSAKLTKVVKGRIKGIMS